MAEPWLIFLLDGKEICSYTMRGSFKGEREETVKLLAKELKVKPEDIKMEVRYRNARRRSKAKDVM